MVSSSSRTTSVSAPRNAHKDLTHTVVGLISQVADELWEVKDRKIKNLTKEDITIVDYKKILVKNSTCLPCSTWMHLTDLRSCRSCRSGEGEAVQQVDGQDEDVSCRLRAIANANATARCTCTYILPRVRVCVSKS